MVVLNDVKSFLEAYQFRVVLYCWHYVNDTRFRQWWERFGKDCNLTRKIIFPCV